jgi:hemolysin III
MANLIKRLRDFSLSWPPEPLSAYTHFLGTVLAIIGFIFLIIKGAHHGSAWHVVSFSIYGATMILLYAASTVYHFVPSSPKIRRILQKVDHSMIFVFIAGSYTPICLVPLRGAWGWSLFGVVWAIAIAGVFFRLFWLDAPRWLYLSTYLLLGWLCIVAIYPIINAVSPAGFVFLAAGGLSYTLGAVFYGLKWPNFSKHFGFHELWHVFVMLGSGFHFLLVWSL